MDPLTPIGMSQDGQHLILVSDAGEQFTVRVDDRLRAALRGDDGRLGRLEMKMESALRPRDIQARIRAGESAEEVAAAALTTVEAIMPFARPVLAERAHVAQTATSASIRRRSADSSPAARTLDEASRHHLSALGLRADEVEWDAWRRDDGRWSLVARYQAAGALRIATFTYDQPGRYVVADDDEAQLLTGEAVAGSTAPPPVEPAGLAAVPTESALGDDAISLVREPAAPVAAAPTPATPPLPEDGALPLDLAPVIAPTVSAESVPTEPEQVPVSEPTADLSETVRSVRQLRSAGPVAPGDDLAARFDDLAADHADADWIVTAPANPPSGPVAPPAVESAVESAVEPAVEPAASAAPESPQAAPEAAPEAGPEAGPEVAPGAAPEAAPDTAAESTPETVEPAAPARPKRKGRSSVPSWDEIMFGGGPGQ